MTLIMIVNINYNNMRILIQSSALLLVRNSITCLLLGLFSVHTFAQETIFQDGIMYCVLDDYKLEVTQKYNFDEAMAFQNYTEESIVIPDTVVYDNNTYTVTSIGKLAFQYCKKLKTVSLPKSLKTIGFAAFIQTPLERIEIPNSVISIGSSIFSGCAQLEEVVLPSSIKSIPYNAFNGCSKLKTIEISENVLEIGPCAFNGCTSLDTILLPDGLTTIGSGAFAECKSLVEINLPESLKSLGNHDYDNYPEGVFENCVNLSYIRIPEGVEFIYYKSLYNCSSLVLAIIPSTVTEIEKNSFVQCDKIKSIYCFNPTPVDIGTDVFCYDQDPYDDKVPVFEELAVLKSCTVYVPSGSKAAYESHDVWGAFKIVEFDPENVNLDELENAALLSHELCTTGIKQFTEQDLGIPETYYDITGKKRSGLQSGINIIKFSNGETKKINVGNN